MSLREEIGYSESLVVEQKEISHHNYKDLNQVREVSIDLDKDLDNQSKRISILRTEIENND
jgi:hypothetical protein